jgi:hypothetical protein
LLKAPQADIYTLERGHGRKRKAWGARQLHPYHPKPFALQSVRDSAVPRRPPSSVEKPPSKSSSTSPGADIPRPAAPSRRAERQQRPFQNGSQGPLGWNKVALATTNNSGMELQQQWLPSELWRMIFGYGRHDRKVLKLVCKQFRKIIHQFPRRTKLTATREVMAVSTAVVVDGEGDGDWADLKRTLEQFTRITSIFAHFWGGFPLNLTRYTHLTRLSFQKCGYRSTICRPVWNDCR